LRELDEVLSLPGQQQNLVTLANKARVLIDCCEYAEATSVVEALKSLRDDKDFPDLVVMVKGEIAVNCSLLPIQELFSCVAPDLFEIIPQTKDVEMKLLWQFYLACTLRVQLRENPQSLYVTPVKNFSEVEHKILDLLKEVIKDTASKNLKAKAYAEIALLLNSTKRMSSKEFKRRAGMTCEQACEMALREDNNDDSVLTTCGKLMRYLRKLKISRELLKKAVSILPSSWSYFQRSRN
jgi:hypothetical protein